MKYLLLIPLFVGSIASKTNHWIVNGAAWYDTDGNKIDAHGGGIYYEKGVYYWIGANSNGTSPNLYLSSDLINWKYLGVQNSIQGYYRPKIAKPNNRYYNTDRFKIYGQKDRLVQALSSDSIFKGYDLDGGAVQLPPNNYTFSDEGLFQDDDGSWYLIFSAEHNNLQINQINNDGTVGSLISKITGKYEAPGIFKTEGVYFLVASSKTAYRPDANSVFTATSLAGPWSAPSGIAPLSNDTYGTQNTHELVIRGSEATTFIYLGDAWDLTGSSNSNYTWTPFNVNATAKSATLNYLPIWRVDPITGVVSVPPL